MFGLPVGYFCLFLQSEAGDRQAAMQHGFAAGHAERQCLL